MRTIRNALFGVAVAGLCTTTPNAKAQMTVIDHANLAQTTLAASRALSELQQLIAQYNQLVLTYQMLTSPTDVVGMVTGLSTPFLQNPLPGTNQLNVLLGGQSVTTGFGQRFYDQNHIYTPTDGSQASNVLVSTANSIANLQGIAATNLQSIQWRLAQLPALATALSTANSITQVDAITGRIALESNYVQAQQAQAQNIMVLATQQQAAQQQREREQFVKDMTDGEAEMMAAAQANGALQ